MLPRLNTLLLVGASTIFIGSTWYSYFVGKKTGIELVQTKWDKEKLTTLEFQGEQLILAQIKETELTTQISELVVKNDKAKNNTIAVRDNLLKRLHDREATTTDSTGNMPQNSKTGNQCTGTELATRDGEFLVRYAANAQNQQVALNRCVEQYNLIYNQNK